MYRIGVDLGGTNIAAGVVDENYNIIKKSSRPTQADRGAEQIIDDIIGICAELCRECKIDASELEGVGVGVPGLVDSERGIIVHTANLPFENTPISERMKRELGVKCVSLGNDANAAALGEAYAGSAKGSSSSIMVTLGTGVGGGVVLGGRLLTGYNGAAGEIGHMVIEKDGAPCGCGRRGCFEAYSSATALVRMTREKIEECERLGRKTIMAQDERVSGRTACDAMRAGDAAAKEVYDKYISYLATGIVNLINIFQPEIISLGGGVSGEGQSLIDALAPIVEEQQYGNPDSHSCTLKIASLKNDAGIIGAALL